MFFYNFLEALLRLNPLELFDLTREMQLSLTPRLLSMFSLVSLTSLLEKFCNPEYVTGLSLAHGFLIFWIILSHGHVVFSTGSEC